jgi:hypothetical protein
MPLVASAQINLVAGWDFGQFTFDGSAVTNTDTLAFETFIPSNFSGADGFNPVSSHNPDGSPISSGRGTISWTLAAAEAQQIYGLAEGSSTTNVTMVDFAGTNMSNIFSDSVGNALVFDGFGGQSFSINVNLTGYEDFVGTNFSFAASADSATTINWLVGGSNFSTNVAAGAYAVYTLDLPANVYGSNAVITGTVAGNAKLRLDNAQINGQVSAIPEPSTYAALVGVAALAAVGLRRRRSK